VQAWKLIGYENRLLAEEDFKDDRKDGGELGAGHTVTVLYEVVPVGAPRPARRDLMTVGVRYKLPEGDRSDGFNVAVPAGGRSRHLPLASAVAEFGLMLRDDRTSQLRWDGLVRRARALAASGADSAGERAGFVQMVELAAALSRLSGTKDPSPLR
jgi:Ca-activated chloride channel family protein